MSDKPSSPDSPASAHEADGDARPGDDAGGARGSANDAGATPPAPKKRASSIGGVLGFVAALGGGFFVGQWINNRGSQDVAIEEGPRFRVALRGDEPTRGASEPLVTIVEFADYQCPYCAQAAGPLDDVVADYDEDVRLIYKHYPLTSHPKAQPAARAAWAALQQGKFWEMHAWLFEHKAELDGLEGEVRGLGLDVARFMQDMGSDASAKAVDDDQQAGGRLGVSGTPAFFVNGHRYAGKMNAAQWRSVIEAELDAAEQVERSGVPRAGVYEAMMKDALARDDRSKGDGGGLDPNAHYRVPADGRPALGPADALVTVVVFSDFQCPFCSRFAGVMHQLVEKHPDVRVVFRNLPLPMHPRAREAAKAALAADRQGQFWAMHDAFFAAQERLGDDGDFAEFAREIGLDVQRFTADMADAALDTRIEEDEALAHAFGIGGTPQSFVNGRAVRGAQPLEVYERVIEEERAGAQKLIEGGIPREQVFAAIMDHAQTHPATAEAKAP
ncbi:MAG: thioredoxin domain-containing protein [Nannocystaceae bacterium]|nr:thioredoxin domain-containing protein [Nannocystaceae bacterium]